MARWTFASSFKRPNVFVGRWYEADLGIDRASTLEMALMAPRPQTAPSQIEGQPVINAAQPALPIIPLIERTVHNSADLPAPEMGDTSDGRTLDEEETGIGRMEERETENDKVGEGGPVSAEILDCESEDDENDNGAENGSEHKDTVEGESEGNDESGDVGSIRDFRSLSSDDSKVKEGKYGISQKVVSLTPELLLRSLLSQGKTLLLSKTLKPQIENIPSTLNLNVATPKILPRILGRLTLDQRLLSRLRG